MKARLATIVLAAFFGLAACDESDTIPLTTDAGGAHDGGARDAGEVGALDAEVVACPRTVEGDVVVENEADALEGVQTITGTFDDRSQRRRARVPRLAPEDMSRRESDQMQRYVTDA